MKRGKFIVIYGANNLGKTVQAKLLVDRLKENGLDSFYLKYPIYELEPTGPKINAALRQGISSSNLELQKLFAQNRRDFEPTLVDKIDRGEWPVTEDYKGTGIAWGVTYDIRLRKMEEINKALLREDLAILLDGERFTLVIERGHRHEAGSRWEHAREVHRLLGERYGWEVVNANQSIEKVSNDMWNIVAKRLL